MEIRTEVPTENYALSDEMPPGRNLLTADPSDMLTLFFLQPLEISARGKMAIRVVSVVQLPLRRTSLRALISESGRQRWSQHPL
jgi:hypothetical protein